MTRQRRFLDTDVVTAARTRLEHVYDIFDSVAVQCSGGKDSAAVVYLMKEFHEKRGLGPVKIIFRDEEMVSPSVIRYMEWLRLQPWADVTWLCLPQAQEIWVLGQREYVLLWSPMRKSEGRLVREIPSWAITAEDFGLDPSVPIPQPVDYYSMHGLKGSVAFITGVRANESMVRFRSLVQKLHENYIVTPYGLPRNVPLKFAKIIYDWEINDVLKYISDSDGRYCEFYDYAAVAGANLRVGIPLHSVAIRRISDVLRTEPEFYDRLIECFPQVDAQRRYWKDFNMEYLIQFYASNGWDGVRDCIAENMTSPGIAKTAMAFANKFRKKQAVDPFSYPIDELIRTLLLKEFHGTDPNPVGPGTRADRLRKLTLNED